jgi:hypothetical protein
MPDTFSIRVEGIDKLEKFARRFPAEIKRNMLAAAQEASTKVLLSTEGIKYPPETAANLPPTPYYKRGTGTVTSHGTRRTSENLGKQWYVKAVGWGGAEIGNRASYARWVHGEEQANAMAKIGWRRLVDVAREKTGEIIKVFDKWVNYTLRKLEVK